MKLTNIKLWSLYALSFFPIVDYLLRKLPVVGSIWDKSILVFLAALAIGLYLQGNRLEKLSFYRTLLAFLLFGIAYLAVGLPSFAVDQEGFRAIYTYSLYAFILPLIIDKELAKKLVRFYLYSGLIIGLHGVYQYITKAPMLDSSWADAGESVRTRVYSIFGSPNIMGTYMILIFPVAAGMAWNTKNKKERVFFAVVALVTLASLLFTKTRGAQLALFVGLVVTSLLFDRRLFFVVLVAGVAAMFVPQIQSRFFQLVDPLYWEKAARDGRIARWLGAYEQMRYNPFFGAGLGHYGGAVAARRFGVPYTDGYYMKTLAEIGLVGLSLMLGTFFTILHNLYKRIFIPLKSLQDWALLLGMFTSIVAILVQNVVENVFEVPAMNFLFWFLVSLTIILSSSTDKEGIQA